MQCPDCGGAMWDNRASKRNPKQPDYKCKNKQCDKAIWDQPKGQSGGSGNGSGGHSAPNGAGPRTSRPLGPLYFVAMKIAKATLDVHMGRGNYTASDLHAATATLFIGATNSGAPLTTPPKSKAAPAPPPPPPQPEPAEPEEDYSDLEGLPF